MKLFVFLVSAFALGQVTAATIMETYSVSTFAVIPDADLSGIVQTNTVSSSSLLSIDAVTVNIVTTGGWNGDLYAYLWHDGVISVLLNRPGRTALLPDGSPSSGMALTLSDLALVDVHLATGPLNGVYQPDGRNVHPLFALDTDPRTAPLSVFNTMTPTGDWRLFIADVAGGEEATLVSWSISLTGSTVPEPASGLLLALAASGALVRRRR